jgi:hypothetical protein
VPLSAFISESAPLPFVGIDVGGLFAASRMNSMAPNDRALERPLNESDIHAYVDGTLPDDRALLVVDYLRSEPGEARRAGFYARLNTLLREVGSQADETGSNRMRAQCTRVSRARAGRRMARAIAVLVMALTGLVGWIAATRVNPEQMDAAVTMALKGAEGERWAAAQTVYISGIGAPDFTDAGLRLVGRRSMNIGLFTRVDSFIYLNAQNEPLIYASTLAMYRFVQNPWIAHRVGTARLLTWRSGWSRYVIAGEARTRGLMLAANSTAKK